MAKQMSVTLILISMVVYCYSDTHPANATADHVAPVPAPVPGIRGIDGIALTKESAVIRCVPTLHGAELVWFKNEQQLTITDDKKYIFDVDNSSLTIKHIGQDDIGVYQCEESEDLRANVTLYSMPIVLKSKSISTAPGYNITVECRVKGLPVPVVTWFSKDRVTEEEQPIVVDGKRFIVQDHAAINDRLIVNNVDYNDSKIYVCVANNTFGSTNGTTLVRVKSQWRGIWPIIGIVIQLVILAVIIFFYERRKKAEMEVERRREAEFNRLHPVDTGRNDGVRQRKSN